MIRKLIISSMVPVLLALVVFQTSESESDGGGGNLSLKTTSVQHPITPKRKTSSGLEGAAQPRSMIGVAGSIAFVVNDVVPKSPAAEAGLQSGDLIVAVDGTQFSSISEFLQSFNQSAPGTPFVFNVRRLTDAGAQEYAVSIPTAPAKPIEN